MDPEKISFRTAVEETARRRRHLLLGNGFSISAYRGFRYPSLLQAAVDLDRSLADLFQELDARDFEHAMALAPDRADEIRAAFIATVASIHPTRSEALSPANREACARFLALFVREKRHPLRGRVFTTNYDLLLCWVLVEHKARLECWDGFDAALKWNSAATKRTSVHYLHGGLHIYEQPGRRRIEARKLRAQWADAKSLVEVVKSEVTAGHFPTFVSEGSHLEKRKRIENSEYLMSTARAFEGACSQPFDALFVLGHSLGEVDHHILSVIAKGSFSDLYVGVFEEADEERARQLASRWARYRERSNLPDLRVRLFDSRKAPVWTEQDGAD